MRAWTTFAVGTSPQDIRTMQPVPDSVRNIVLLDTPPEANASKIATWVQRLVNDGTIPGECPDEFRSVVELGALGLTSSPDQALAISMNGNPIGEKMRVKLNASPEEQAWLLFGIADTEELANE